MCNLTIRRVLHKYDFHDRKVEKKRERKREKKERKKEPLVSRRNSQDRV